MRAKSTAQLFTRPPVERDTERMVVLVCVWINVDFFEKINYKVARNDDSTTHIKKILRMRFIYIAH